MKPLSAVFAVGVVFSFLSCTDSPSGPQTSSGFQGLWRLTGARLIGLDSNGNIIADSTIPSTNEFIELTSDSIISHSLKYGCYIHRANPVMYSGNSLLIDSDPERTRYFDSLYALAQSDEQRESIDVIRAEQNLGYTTTLSLVLHEPILEVWDYSNSGGARLAFAEYGISDDNRVDSIVAVGICTRIKDTIDWPAQTCTDRATTIENNEHIE